MITFDDMLESFRYQLKAHGYRRGRRDLNDSVLEASFRNAVTPAVMALGDVAPLVEELRELGMPDAADLLEERLLGKKID